jgi:hypothetical protein
LTTACHPEQTEKDNIFPRVLNPMKLSALIFLICLVLAGTASAKLATPEIAITVAQPNIPVSPWGVAYCSDDDASPETPVGMGELAVTSTPSGANISVDGSLWTQKKVIGTWPTQVTIHIPVFTPYTGMLDTGTHSVSVAADAFKSYTATVHICSQKITYVHPTMVAITTPTTTTTVTTTGTTTATATATSVTPTTTTAAATTSTAPAATGTVTTTAGVPAITPSVTDSAEPPGYGSLSVTTIPAGAAVSIDGVQRGISPAVISGLAAGSHTVLLRLDGYQDLSAPVLITAGMRNEFSTGLAMLPAAGSTVQDTPASGVPAAAEKTRSPGFEMIAGFTALGVLLYLRKGSGR